MYRLRALLQNTLCLVLPVTWSMQNVQATCTVTEHFVISVASHMEHAECTGYVHCYKTLCVANHMEQASNANCHQTIYFYLRVLQEPRTEL
jgi:acid stress-induced BolA-like protein IbaG/YrbA